MPKRLSFILVAAVIALLGAGLAAATPALADSPATAAAATADEAKVRAVLTQTIADFQAGAPNFDSMEPDLASAVKAQSASLNGLKSLGPPETFERIGDGVAPYEYKVTFEAGAALTWSITLSPSGKIAGLWVQ